jgi:two-component system chemotaxis response regulator CheB
MKQIRTLILDDSDICRAQLRAIVETDGAIKVVGEARNGDRVLELLDRTKPDVLLVDLEMPGTPGHATIERVMAHHPLPILVVTGVPSGRRQAEVFEAIKRGALQLAAKPLRGDRAAEAALRAQVKQLAGIPVVRHVAGKLGPGKARPRTLAPPPISAPQSGTTPLIVGVGASAGGPVALATMLAELPVSLGAAVAVVQHLPDGFTSAFAAFLKNRIELPLHVVDAPVRWQRGHVYLAPDARHLTSEGSALSVSDAPPVEGHRPAVDVLFAALARDAGPRALGVLLSGMGRDGVDGLLRMRRAGAFTLAQDEASSGVFGMPMAALQVGAATIADTPVGLGQRIVEWCRLTQHEVKLGH